MKTVNKLDKSAITYDKKFNPYAVIILFLTFAVPLLVLPVVLDNAFNAPKNLLIIVGVFIMVGIYATQFLRGREVPISRTSTPKIILLVILLNGFSFFYTGNYYFTQHAALINITCLLIVYFVGLYVDGTNAYWVIITTAVSGLLVCIETWLQFFNIFILFPWAHPGINVMGTIGNSNYLGAYLIFPLFAMAALLFHFRGRSRFIPFILFIFMMGAFLFTRGRAGWMGFFLALPLFLYLIDKIHGFSFSTYFKANSRTVIKFAVVMIAVLASLSYAAPQRLHNMFKFRSLTETTTLEYRTKYFRASFWLFKQSPLFGTGLRSYRNMVYLAQAEINKIDPKFFENHPEPKPRMVHMEYLETLNDGGLLAAAVLSLFFIVVMRHGWKVIRDERIDPRERIIASTAFCSMVAIMLSAFFFFPFRVNSTMFMTVLTMGLMEALYLRNYSLISPRPGWKSEIGVILIPAIFLLIMGVVWYTGIKPFTGEIEHFKYKKALANGRFKEAERFILKALDYDPHNTAYALYTCELYLNALKDYGRANDYIEKTLVDFNGDITMWSIYFIKGLIKFQMGSLVEAQRSFQKALYFNPTFEPAQQKLAEVQQVIKDHDKVLIKFR